jgi:hypothetical protein
VRFTVQDDGLGFNKFRQPLHETFTSDPRLLESAKADTHVAAEEIISHGARPQPPGDLIGMVNIAGKN